MMAAAIRKTTAAARGLLRRAGALGRRSAGPARAFRRQRPRLVLWGGSVLITGVAWGLQRLLPGFTPAEPAVIIQVQAALAAVGFPVLSLAVQRAWAAWPLPLGRALTEKLLAVDRLVLSLVGLAALLLFPDGRLGLAVVLVTMFLLAGMYRQTLRLDETELEDAALDILRREVLARAKTEPEEALDLVVRIGHSLAQALGRGELEAAGSRARALRVTAVEVFRRLAQPDRPFLLFNNINRLEWQLGLLMRRLADAAVRPGLAEDAARLLVYIPACLVCLGFREKSLPLVRLGLYGLRGLYSGFSGQLDRAAQPLIQIFEELINQPSQEQEQDLKSMVLEEYRRLLAFCAGSGNLEALEHFCYRIPFFTAFDSRYWAETWFLLAALLIGRYAEDAESFARALTLLKMRRNHRVSPEELAGAAIGNRVRLYALEFIVRPEELGAAVVDAALLAGVLAKEVFGADPQSYKAALCRQDPDFAEKLAEELDRLRRQRPAWVEGLLAELERWAYGGCEGV